MGLLLVDAGEARVQVDPARGGRLESLRVRGLELLSQLSIPAVPEAILGGCFPMAPFAGRLRNGRFTFRDQTVTLPTTLRGHAIHGLVHDVAWDLEDATTLRTALAGRWPFGGIARQRFDLAADRLCVTLTVTAEQSAMPVVLGFHPWFRSRLAKGQQAILNVVADKQYERDRDGLPTGATHAVSAGPWDDCFTGLHWPVVIEWPGALRLSIRSTSNHLVVFNELDEALCVEPQTDCPDAFNLGRGVVLEPGQSAETRMELGWAL